MDLSIFFEQLLGLSAPYKIIKIERKPSDEQESESVHIYIEVSKDYRPVNASQVKSTMHDTVARTWRHLDLFQYTCYIHCEVPKFKYGNGEDLAFWIGYLHDMAVEFKDKKMMTLTKTLNKHFDRIINVLKSGMDNSISEAFNNNVQIMKRVARGYKKFEHYIQMIKIHCAWAT